MRSYKNNALISGYGSTLSLRGRRIIYRQHNLPGDEINRYPAILFQQVISEKAY